MDTKRVQDLMLPLSDYATIGHRRTLHDALIELSKAQMGLTYDRHHHRAILVLDDGGEVVGKLTHWAILRALEPKLLADDDVESLVRAGLDTATIERMRQQLAPFGGSLARMCRQAALVRVSEAMVPAGHAIDGAAPLTEAIRTMVLHHEQSLLVTSGGAVTGILRLSDLFEEVADAIRATGGE